MFKPGLIPVHLGLFVLVAAQTMAFTRVSNQFHRHIQVMLEGAI